MQNSNQNLAIPLHYHVSKTILDAQFHLVPRCWMPKMAVSSLHWSGAAEAADRAGGPEAGPATGEGEMRCRWGQYHLWITPFCWDCWAQHAPWNAMKSLAGKSQGCNSQPSTGTAAPLRHCPQSQMTRTCHNRGSSSLFCSLGAWSPNKVTPSGPKKVELGSQDILVA